MHIQDDILNIARLYPSHPAIETDDRIITFSELEATSAHWAERLRTGGLQSGEPCWVCMANGPEFIIAVLAIVRAGGVAVPVNPRYTDHELRQLAGLCPPAAVCCSQKLCGRLRSALSPSLTMRFIARTDAMTCEIETGAAKRGFSVDRALATRNGCPGMVYFTSGSTGCPKAILLTHDNIATNARATAQVLGLCGDDRSVVCMQMCHSYTLTKQLLAHLGAGAAVVLAGDFFQPALVLDLVERRGITTLFAVPSMHAMMGELIERHSLSLTTLRLVVTGGAPMPHRVQLGYCDNLPHVAFVSSYGLSEASPCVAALKPEWARSKLGSVGQPIPGVETMIRDREHRPVPTGEVGELCVRGPNVMVGYLNNPAATASVLREGWLHTGDLARQDQDGCIYLCGRRDDMILRGGENIYPAEVENVLCSHPAVMEAAVIGIPHPLLGQDVIAYLTLRDPESYDPQSLHRHCREHLAGFKVPRELRVVDALARTSNGKISRTAMREREPRHT